MAKQTNIDDLLIAGVTRFLEKENHYGIMARPEELDFLKESSWLKDTAVIDVIRHRKGSWEVSLMFAHYKDPLRFIVRPIANCYNEQKAISAALLYQKAAAKDRRGTLTVALKDFNFNYN